MNKSYILFHLNEALEDLTRTIAKIEADTDYGEIEFEIAMAHAYNHLNTAWNARHADDERVSNLSHEDFVRWRRFPSDIDMSA